MKWLFKFPPHPMSASALPGEIWPSKTWWNEWKNVNINSIYPYLWPSVGSKLQGLTIVQQCILTDDVQECLWIQEATGKVWISVEQNIIDTAVNEWKKHLRACVCTMGQHFIQFYCRQLKNKTVGWSVSQSIKNVNKMCFCALFRLGNNTTLGENVIFCWLLFPQVVQEQTLG